MKEEKQNWDLLFFRNGWGAGAERRRFFSFVAQPIGKRQAKEKNFLSVAKKKPSDDEAKTRLARHVVFVPRPQFEPVDRRSGAAMRRRCGRSPDLWPQALAVAVRRRRCAPAVATIFTIYTGFR